MSDPRENPSLLRIDWLMTGTILALLAFSALFVYSAKHHSADLPMGWLVVKQLIWAGLGLCAYLAMARADYRRMAALAPWLYGAALVLLLVVLLPLPFIPVINGARRWIPLPGFDLQPSEPAKLAVVFAMAAYLGAPGRDTDDMRTFWTCAAIAGAPFLLIFAEPDLGTAMVLAPVTLAQMFYAGVRRRLLLGLVAAALAAAAALVFWVKYENTDEIERMAAADRPKIVLPRCPLLDDYQKNRIKVHLNANADPLEEGWNKLQSQISVASGGLFGKGYLRGSQNILGFLPRTVAPTDFIFCVVAEETGFAGGAGLILLYTLLLGRCMRASMLARDEFGRILALGIGAMVFCHVFVNIAMTIGLVPITGLPLPLMSYGGSFLVSTLIALGLVQSVYLRRRNR